MIDNKVKIVAAIAYINWIGYLISWLVFRDLTISYAEEDFYTLHNHRALFIHVILTLSTFVLSRTSFGSMYSYGTVSAICSVFALWGLLYAAMGKSDRIPGLDDVLDIAHR